MIKILALDMSLTNSGVCRLVDVRAGQPVWDVETVFVPPLRVPGLRAGTEKNAPRTGGGRLLWWHEWLTKELLDGYELLIMEAPAMSGGGRVFDMGEAYGVVKLACCAAGVSVALVSPKSLKKWATGSGEADKRRMIDTATEALGGEVTLDEHQADAYWLSQIAYAVFGDGEPDNAYRCAVAAKLRGGAK